MTLHGILYNVHKYSETLLITVPLPDANVQYPYLLMTLWTGTQLLVDWFMMFTFHLNSSPLYTISICEHLSDSFFIHYNMKLLDYGSNLAT